MVSKDEKYPRVALALEVLKVAAVPVSIALIGLFLSQAQADRQIDASYVTISIGVLQAPIPETEDEAALLVDQELREWAVDLLAETSPVELSSNLATALSDGSTTFPTDFVTANCRIVNAGGIRLPICN